jgi:hypothetical protein
MSTNTYTEEQLMWLAASYQQQYASSNLTAATEFSDFDQSALEALDELREEEEEENAFTSFMIKNGFSGKKLKAEVIEHMTSWKGLRLELKEYEKKLLTGPFALKRDSSKFKFLMKRFAEGQRLVDIEGLVKDSQEYNDALSDWTEINAISDIEDNIEIPKGDTSNNTIETTSSSSMSASAPSFVPSSTFSSSSYTSSTSVPTEYSNIQEGTYYQGSGNTSASDTSSNYYTGNASNYYDQSTTSSYYYSPYEHPSHTSTSSYYDPSSSYTSYPPSQAYAHYFNNSANIGITSSNPYQQQPAYTQHQGIGQLPTYPPVPPQTSQTTSTAYEMAALLRSLEEADANAKQSRQNNQ